MKGRTLSKGDGALVLHADGSCSLVYPRATTTEKPTEGFFTLAAVHDMLGLKALVDKWLDEEREEPA